MSAINTAWFADEVASDLVAETNISQYFDTVEREIEVKALIEGVRVDEIPLDVDDYYSSRIVILYATLLYKRELFMGYWGSSDGDGEDIYQQKLEKIEERIRKIEPSITRESILGMETSDGTPKGKMAVVNVMPIYNGASRQ